NQSWVLSGAHTSYTNGRLAQQYRPEFSSGPSSPGALPPEVAALSGPTASFAYDSRGRTVQATDFAGNAATLTYRDGALSVDVRDVEQTGGTHQGSFTTITRDGHGRTISQDVHLQSGPAGASGDLVTSIQYQATGEPLATVQTSPSGTVTRQLTYD